MVIRMLLFALLLIGALLLLRRYGRQARARRQAPRPEADRVERMVSCAVCGLHLPASQAVHGDGRAYCGVAHREARRAMGD